MLAAEIAEVGTRIRNKGTRAMSYYQYHEFRATDRLLSEADRKALRGVSSRAEITSTSFAVHYDYGDFKGDEKEFLRRWFDMHLYLATGGTRRLMIRLPARFARRGTVERIIGCCELAEFVDVGDDLLLDVYVHDEGGDHCGWGDGPGWLDALAPLRSELLSGDLRLAYLVWLAAADRSMLQDDAREPLKGIGPLSEGLKAFGRFFGIDPDLVRAAAESSAGPDCGEIPQETAVAGIRKMPDGEKIELLHRFLERDPLAHADLQARVRPSEVPDVAAGCEGFRTLSELRMRASAIREERRAIGGEAPGRDRKVRSAC